MYRIFDPTSRPAGDPVKVPAMSSFSRDRQDRRGESRADQVIYGPVSTGDWTRPGFRPPGVDSPQHAAGLFPHQPGQLGPQDVEALCSLLELTACDQILLGDLIEA